MKNAFICFIVAAGLVYASASAETIHRQALALDGRWSIGETIAADMPPAHYSHHGPVPGLTHSAVPAFRDVDRFESRSYLANMVFNRLRAPADIVTTAGTSHQTRNWFWYRSRFDAPERRDRAFLRVNKAQFSSEVRINGIIIGRSTGCAASNTYDITNAIYWSSSNEVVIRIGAHPGVLPFGSACGVDMEKTRWTPGIYDRVSIAFTDNLHIETTQVAPHVTPLGITVQTTLVNSGDLPKVATLRLLVHRWRSDVAIGAALTTLTIGPGETRKVTTELALPTAALWSPEAPSLYVVDASTGTDEVSTRFGLREIRFDTATQRAWLNGKPYFLRGSNIALHRFFEDPLSGTLPWNDTWVKLLLGTTAKSMHWNAMRFTIGPVPERWLEIADEQGLLIQQEFPIWNSKLIGAANPTFSTAALIDEFSRWMRDSWNHPSVALWDASNETELPQLAEQVIPAVRSLDMSGRAWENSYNPPQGVDDPVEDHPYEFVANEYAGLGPAFDMMQLETRSGAERASRTVPTGHAKVLNEYGWLWLNRDGSPTLLTPKIYASLPFPTLTASERLMTQAYLLAGLTEYWRAWRRYAGVMHFVYLTGEVPGGFTSDNFLDPRTLTLQPAFADYVGEAFRPLGVYINFWQRQLLPNDLRNYTVMLVNDEARQVVGRISLSLEGCDGKLVSSAETTFEISADGQTTVRMPFQMPDVEGRYLLKATAQASGFDNPTVSRRWVDIKREKPTPRVAKASPPVYPNPTCVWSVASRNRRASDAD